MILLVVIGLFAGSSVGLTFEENYPGGGPYEWEANNWYNGSTYVLPTSADRGEIGYGRTCVVDGQTAEADNMEIGTASPGGTLTVNSGSLRIYEPTGWAIKLGKDYPGTINITGGTMTIDSDYAHGGLQIGQSGATGTVNISGGTLNTDSVSIGYAQDGTMNVSGGVFNASGRVMITHQGTQVTNTLLEISGDADINLTGTEYNDGLNTYSGGTLSIVGSSATIDIANDLWIGGHNDDDPNTVLSFQADSGGVSTINCDELLIAVDSILDLSSDGNTSSGTYTLVSCTSEVTQADLNNFSFSAATDTNKWSNLTVTGSGPYLVQVDYTGGLATYTLTVNSGTGDGAYEEDTVVNISADAPGVGQLFDVWTGDTTNVANVNDPNTTITMPAASTAVTATYVDDPNTFALTVNSGSGDGIYDPNTIVDIYADPPGGGLVFDVWTGDTQYITDVDEPNTTFTMPSADAGVTATYMADPNAPSTYTLTVNSGTGDGDYDPNTVVNIYADAPGVGWIFDDWTGDTTNVANVNDANTTITMPAANTEVTATYDVDPNATVYKLTVVGGVIRDTGLTDGNFAIGADVWIRADLPDPNKVFNLWVMTAGPSPDPMNKYKEEDRSTAMLTMKASPCTYESNYVDDPGATIDHFVHGQDDGNGVYLWDNPYNWTLGRIPLSGEQTEIGDNWSVVHGTIRNYDVVGVQELEIAEYGMNDPDTGNGCSLTIEGTGSFSATGYLDVGKDKVGYLYMQPGSSVNVGGVLKMGADWRWGRGIVEMDGAYLYAGGGLDVGTQDDPNNEAVGGSKITATDANLIFNNNIIILSLNPAAPAEINLKGTTVWDQTGGTECVIDLDAIFNMEGGNLSVTVKNLDFNTPSTVLKLSGTGVSTISALAVTFANGSQLDVSGLNVSDGNYTVIDGTSISDSGLQFAAGTDANVWSFAFDGGNGNLILTKGGGGGPSTYSLTVNSGTGDGSYEEDTVVNIVADTPSAGDIFDVWTGDTTNVANVNNADTDITMPPASTTVTATYKDDPATYQLTVNSGTGGGYYGPSTVVDIVASSAPMGKLFDMWTGDTTNVDDIYVASTTITMPAADTGITATYADDPNYVASAAGYAARACGFDMDRDGIIGEVGEDDQVGDGVTTDPDGDGVDEDIIYVDASSGNDTTGDGSAGNPYKTIQKAFDVADGPGDGAEDIIAIAGVFQEELTLTQSGVAGYYIRDSFQFPDNPMMLIGWDKDGDGEYPPYDADDTAVLDGNVDPNTFLGLAITNDPAEKSYVEIAHLSIRNYGYDTLGDNTPRGAMKLAPQNVGTVSHLYFHDVEMKSINDGINTDGYTIIWSFWCGSTPMQHIALINNLIDGTSGYGSRGSPTNGSGYWRVQNNTYNFTLGWYKDEGKPMLGTVWKVWGEHTDVEILYNLINGATSDSSTQIISGGGINVRPCTRNYTIRGNESINCRTAISVDGLSDGGCHDRSIDGIIIDQNIIRNTYTGWNYGPLQGIILKEGGTTTAETIEDVTITNNFISILDTGQVVTGIDSQVGNDGGPESGVITIAGNTIYGPGGGNDYRGISVYSARAYPQEDYVIKNNIFANTGPQNMNTRVSHAPTGWIANGNIYDDDGNFNWDSSPTALITFAEWQTASGGDANSTTGDPVFVDEATGDLHIDPSDTLVEGSGVDITSITTVDYDGDARSSSTPWAGADIGDANGDPNAPPTYSLTVNSGTGDGSYEEDTVVNIYADAPGTGQAFDVWTGDTTNVANVNDANTTITMPAASTAVTATYMNLLYALAVNDGTGDGNYTYNTVVNIYAADPNAGQQFDVWTGDTSGIANVNDANTTITMPASAANITATYEDIPGPTNDYASSESTTRGTVSGDYTDTLSSNDTYEALTEVVHANRSKLEHEWTFSVTGGSTVTFYVEAYKAGTEDDFDFDYSTDGSNWTNMLTVTKTSDDDNEQSYSLPSNTSGTVYIRVIDTNRVNKAKDLDTVYVDHMYIRSE